MPQTRQSVPSYSSRIENIENSAQPIIMGASDLSEGEGFSWHRHRRAQLVYANQGVMTVTTSSAIYTVPPQRAVWMPGETAHQIDARRSVTMRSLYIKLSLTEAFSPHPYVLQITPLLRELIATAFAIGNGYLPDSPQSRIMQVILDQIAAQPPLELVLPLPSDSRLLRITRSLMINPADRRTLDEWAKEVGASKRTLNRLFSKQTDMSFQKWRQQLRLQHSLELLVAGESVTRIAGELGYDNVSAFIAMFRSCMGTTPRQYLQMSGSSVISDKQTLPTPKILFTLPP